MLTGPLLLSSLGACAWLSAPPAIEGHGPGVTELSHRGLPGTAGAQIPADVSATFAAGGLQVYITGLSAPCDTTPWLARDTEHGVLVLRERGEPAETPSCGHTLLVQLDDVSPAEHTVRVVRADGTLFGEAHVTAETR